MQNKKIIIIIAILTIRPFAFGQDSAAKNAQLLLEVDRNLNPESFESYRKLINIEPNGKKKEFVLFTVKMGKDRVAALFISPARPLCLTVSSGSLKAHSDLQFYRLF